MQETKPLHRSPPSSLRKEWITRDRLLPLPATNIRDHPLSTPAIAITKPALIYKHREGLTRPSSWSRGIILATPIGMTPAGLTLSNSVQPRHAQKRTTTPLDTGCVRLYTAFLVVDRDTGQANQTRRATAPPITRGRENPYRPIGKWVAWRPKRRWQDITWNRNKPMLVRWRLWYVSKPDGTI